MCCRVSVQRLLAKPLWTVDTMRYVTCCRVSVQRLLAEPLWTVDTQKNQQTITNVVAKRAVGLYLILSTVFTHVTESAKISFHLI